MSGVTERAVTIPTDGVELDGDLTVPADAGGLVGFAHGSGSNRKSPRNRQVAQELNDRGLATFLFDLLTETEDRNRANRFDSSLQTDRFLAATDWVEVREETAPPVPGYFGASTGGGSSMASQSSSGIRMGRGSIASGDSTSPDLYPPAAFRKATLPAVRDAP